MARRVLGAMVAFFCAAALPVMGQPAGTAPSGDRTPALMAVAKAWSLQAGGPEAGSIWPGARPEDLASSALLWKSGGPPPPEGWRLKQAERSWEAAARKAGVPLDDTLQAYRARVGEKERAALATQGGEWQILAELRTLERLTGKNLRALAAELVETEFEVLLAEAAPAGGPTALSARDAPTPHQPAPPSDDGAVNPMGTDLDQAPTSWGTVGSSSTVQPKGR